MSLLKFPSHSSFKKQIRGLFVLFRICLIFIITHSAYSHQAWVFLGFVWQHWLPEGFQDFRGFLWTPWRLLHFVIFKFTVQFNFYGMLIFFLSSFIYKVYIRVRKQLLTKKFPALLYWIGLFNCASSFKWCYFITINCWETKDQDANNNALMHLNSIWYFIYHKWMILY